MGGIKETRRPVEWPELDKLESGYESALKSAWSALQEDFFRILKLGTDLKSVPSSVKGDLPDLDTFTFTEDQRAALMQSLQGYLGQLRPQLEDSPVRWYYGQSYSLGLIQASHMIGAERPILDIIKNRDIFDELAKNGFNLVRDRATTAIKERILPEIEAQVMAGTNPLHVASRLEKLFGNANSDWERLARSEMGMSAETAKLDEWVKRSVKKVEFTPAPDACPICAALAGDYDIAKCPLPVRDTHPRCRCSTRPAATEVTQHAIREHEREIKGLSHEEARILDDKGNLLFKKSGTDKNVYFDAAERARMAGQTLTHNHPSGRPLSDDDIPFAVGNGLGEVRAVTPEGRIYRLRPPEGATTFNPSDLGRIASAVRRQVLSLTNELTPALNSGKITTEEFNRRVFDMLSARIAEEFKYRYEKEVL